jgi:signal transduction histidine kinase/ActR/RegA family two-component response regulator
VKVTPLLEGSAGVVVAHENITERKTAQLALESERASLADRVETRTSELKQANVELARAARLKDEFLATMSHELRTPLNVILGMTEVLNTGLYGTMNPKQLRAITQIHESGHHLLSLINDILDLSKVEVGTLELSVTPIEVKDICQASLRFIKQMAMHQQVDVSYLYGSDMDTIHADGRRLKQILINLLTNAVKFTPEGGQVRLEVTSDPFKEIMHFTVTDTGIGIAAEDMPRLFKPFVQIDSSLSRKYEGTGLGLSMVARLTELHGGEISVESEPGQGSRFTVSLPIRDRHFSGPDGGQPLPDNELLFASSRGLAQNAASVPETTLENLRAVTVVPTILLAEDDKTGAIVISDYLTAKNYKVVVARNGGTAIETARRLHPDLILMDIQMPGMDGLEAIRQLRADNRFDAIPIIALTALAMAGDRERCLQAGANDYISKPVKLSELFLRIEGLLRAKSGNDE